MHTLTTLPTAPATPCPPWCVTLHEDPADRFHYSEFAWVGSVGVDVEISDDGAPGVGVSLGHEPQFLDLTDVDALIAALTVKRALLADLSASVTP